MIPFAFHSFFRTFAPMITKEELEGKRIAVLLSGGVDSAVVVYCLAQLGLKPDCFYIKIGPDEEEEWDCTSEEDLEMATAVAHKYGCQLEVVDCHREYWDQVTRYTMEKVRTGMTPNPDVMCNRLIKFGAFHEKRGHDYDLIATGHYAQTEVDGEDISKVRLFVGRNNQNSAENKAFAQQIKAEADREYPGLIKDIFIGMGYEVVEGPEIEYDEYNFTKLNIPANHPAKDEQDTFYINKDILLRTQTSPVQVHEMEKGKLPIRMIAPGRVFRADEVDATHSPSFHQIEGMVIDKDITFADLKGTLEEFAKQLFGDDVKVKFRPHHFPFTEPSAEVDVSCFKCGGKGCRFCKAEGWIEILGCGMVHPKVLKMSGIDPDEYQGFAFGVGLERITLLKYEIDDMRLLYENDDRFLSQF